MSRIDDMMSDDVEVEETSNESEPRDRLKSIMDEEYEPAEERDEERPETKKYDPTGKEGDKKEVKEEKEDKEDKKEKKEEKKEDEEEKKEEKKEESTKKKIKYKVDGQEIEEEVDEQDLINNYSGSKAIQKRFTEFDKVKKDFESKKVEFDADIKIVKDELGSLRNSFTQVIDGFKNGNSDIKPLDGVYNLLDKMGLDAKEYDRAMFFHFVPEVSKFLELDDTGREAYLLKKDNEWLTKGAKKIEDQRREADEYRAKLEKENSIKVQAGISEEKYSELAQELTDKFGIDKLTTEQVVEWNQIKPTYERAERLSEMVEGKIDPIKLTKIIAQNPEVSDEKILDFLGHSDVLKKKVMEEVKGKIPPKPPSSKNSSSHSDEDDYFKQYFRRR